MFLRPVLGVNFSPFRNILAIQTRNTRSTIKISPERFQLTLDVRDFTKAEMRVKAQPEFLTIEGRQERKTKQGCVIRSFTRKFRLPEGCVTSSMESKLSPEGILRVTAKRDPCDKGSPCESFVPIRYSGPADDDVPMIAPTSDSKPKSDGTPKCGQKPYDCGKK